MEIIFKPIGYISSPYKDKKDIPRQSVLKENIFGKVKFEEKFKDGMYGYKAGDYIVLLFNFHESKSSKMIINPHGSKEERGVFATRSPNRPNGIGMSIVKIVEIDEDGFTFDGVDMLDNTPVIDIKPYSSGLNPKEN